MYLRNSCRVRNDRLYYRSFDSYTMPEYLREAREKYKDYGLPTPSLTGYNNNEDIDDEEGLLPIMSYKDLLHMAFKRLCCAVVWFIDKAPDIPARIKQMRIQEGVRRLIGLQNRISSMDLDQIWDSEDSIDLMEMCSYPSSMDLNTISTDGSGRDEFVKSKYGDTFRVVEICIENNDSDLENFLSEYKDFQSLILQEGCACLIWVMNAQTRILLVTESPNKWTPQQLYRRILSDVALTDSIVIGHPYYWHPVIRKKLRRAVRQMRKLYAAIDRIEMKKLNSEKLPRVRLESYSDSDGTRTGTFSSLECCTQVKVKTERKRTKPIPVSVVQDAVIDAWYRRNHETRFPEPQSSHVSSGVAMPETRCYSETYLDPNIHRGRGMIDNRRSLSNVIQDFGSSHHSEFEPKIHPRSADKTGLSEVGVNTPRRKHRSKRNHRNDDARNLNGEKMAEHPSSQSPRASSTTALESPGRSRRRTEAEPSPDLNAHQAGPSTSRNSEEVRVIPTAATSEWGDQDVNYEKLGLSRTRHSHSHPTVNQDQIPGPPGPNFNEPNAMPGAAIRVNTHHDGIHDLPPADADSSNPLRAIQPRQFSSTDNLSGVVDQLGLETRISSHSGHVYGLGHVDPQPHRHGSGPVFHDPQRSQNEISHNKCINSLDLDSSSGSRFPHKSKSLHKSQPPEGDGF